MWEFQLNRRVILASQRSGDALDVTSVAAATRAVVRGIESMIFNGNTTAFGGLPIYGYRTHPMRNTGSGSDWGTASNIYPNVISMLAGLDADNAPGPFVLYLSPTQFAETLKFADASHTITVRNLLLQNIPGLEDVKRASAIPAGEAVMVSMGMETVDLAIAEDITLVEWESRGGLTSHFRVMMAAAPRVKSDYDGRSGIYHMTGI